MVILTSGQMVDFVFFVFSIIFFFRLNNLHVFGFKGFLFPILEMIYFYGPFFLEFKKLCIIFVREGVMAKLNTLIVITLWITSRKQGWKQRSDFYILRQKKLIFLTDFLRKPKK
jgi:hypothetical protein